MSRNILTCATCVRRTALAVHAAGAVTGLRAFHARAQLQNRPQTSRAANDAPRTLDLSPGTPEEEAQRRNDRVERIVKKELQHLTRDPWKIAECVRKHLKADRYQEALLITQRMSKDLDVSVSWNALIEYLGSEDKLDSAMKLYNDMKKYGQLPTAYTYNILLTACVKSSHPKRAVGHAMKLYNILLRDARLEANTRHMNTALNVCSKAHDLDSMFIIADSINEKSRRADERTYTIILGTFSNHIIHQLGKLPAKQKKANVDKVIGQAKALWSEVITKWRKGEVLIDESTVCAMTRLMLIAGDSRAVFSVMEQTMNVPDLSKSPAQSAEEDVDDMFATSKSTAVQTRGHYVEAGPKILGQVLLATSNLRLTSVGIRYWNLLVQQHEVEPDQYNWDALFNLLLQGKSSAHTASVLKHLPAKWATSAIYQRAMKTCLADNLNHNAVKNATVVLDDMVSRLHVPDLLTMRLYLQVVLSTHSKFRGEARAGDLKAATRAYATQIVDGLVHLWEPYLKLHKHFFEDNKPGDDRSWRIRYNDQREVIATARQMYGAFNKVLTERMLPHQDLKEIAPIGARINRMIQDFYSNREAKEPNLRKKKDPAAEKQEALDREMEEAYDELTTSDLSRDQSLRVGRHYVWDTTKEMK